MHCFDKRGRAVLAFTCVFLLVFGAVIVSYRFYSPVSEEDLNERAVSEGENVEFSDNLCGDKICESGEDCCIDCGCQENELCNINLNKCQERIQLSEESVSDVVSDYAKDNNLKCNITIFEDGYYDKTPVKDVVLSCIKEEKPCGVYLAVDEDNEIIKEIKTC